MLLWNWQANVSMFRGRRLKMASGVAFFNKTEPAEVRVRVRTLTLTLTLTRTLTLTLTLTLTQTQTLSGAPVQRPSYTFLCR